VDDHLQPLSTLAEVRDVGASICSVADYPGSGEQCRLGDPLYRFHNCAGTPACCRGKKSNAEAEALGRSRGGFSTKIHIRCENQGHLITFLLSPGQAADVNLAELLMEQGAIHRAVGRPQLRPKRLVADKGYTGHRFRSYLRRRGIRYTIPRRNDEKHRGRFDHELYRKRNIAERLINRLKQFRRIATRYEKRAANFSAMITLAAIFLLSQFAYRT
jgi:transposase